jgi:hypothetical protein
MGKVIMNMKNLAVKAGENVTMMLVEEFKEINYALIYRGGDIPWVAAYGYDKATQSWAQGHYFNDFLSAVRYIQNIKDTVPFLRLEEIATKTMDKLIEIDWQEAEEFLKDELDLTETEVDYFGLTETLDMIKGYEEDDDYDI